MGNLSESFNNKDFTCKCLKCRGDGEYKIHLGLIGALEMIVSHFRKTPKILLGFRCEDTTDKMSGAKRSIHNMGKAAHITIEGVPMAELYNFAKEIPEVRGLGIYPKDGFIHVDTRAGDKVEWVKEGDSYNPLTQEKKKLYGLA